MLQSKKTVYDTAGNTTAVKSVGQLRNRAGAAVGKPFPRGCPVIRDPGRGLQIQYDHEMCIRDRSGTEPDMGGFACRGQ